MQPPLSLFLACCKVTGSTSCLAVWVAGTSAIVCTSKGTEFPFCWQCMTSAGAASECYAVARLVAFKAGPVTCRHDIDQSIGMVVTAHDVMQQGQAVECLMRHALSGRTRNATAAASVTESFCHAMPCHDSDVRPMLSRSKICRRMVEIVTLLHAWLLSGVLSPHQVFPVLACQKPQCCVHTRYVTAFTSNIPLLPHVACHAFPPDMSLVFTLDPALELPQHDVCRPGH